MRLIDSHCHLEDEKFEYDWRQALERMKEAGVEKCVLGGSNMPTNEHIADLVPRSEMLYGTVGVHPHEAKDLKDEDFARMDELLKHPRMVGVGEIGLDYFYDYSPREVQAEALIKQMEFARERGLPVVFHVRDAHGDMTELLRARRGSLPAGVFHCFSGSVETAKQYLDMGFYISFAGPVTFKNASKLQEVAKFVPDDRFMVETDSPYLAPVPLRGKRNEPAWVVNVAKVVAQLRGASLETVAEQAFQNTCRLFGIREEKA